MSVNPEKRLYLGVDTSAYTTSLALVDEEEKLVFDGRKVLPVKAGALGLRQSEAVFSHLQNLTVLLEKKELILKKNCLAAVAASARPRPVKGSYMPVFKVSEALGLFLSRTAGLPYVDSSHQEGHLLAGLWSAGLPAGRYLAVHVSGGTTELLEFEEISPGRLSISILGGSADLNAGQFIDRLGLLMGLKFPAGQEFEALASEFEGPEEADITLPVAVKNSEISFSGPASQAERLLEKGISPAAVARAVEICIADSLICAIINLKFDMKNFNGFLAVGGVMSNITIRNRLISKLKSWEIDFAEPRYSTDNAVGLAVQARRMALSGQLQ
ncbi:MAG: O-sialoglycoprotein endopeptidase [Bacillota bacterium]|nr:O-sialoglycoprotein endopeptidase [Bacillota bacterium]